MKPTTRILVLLPAAIIAGLTSRATAEEKPHEPAQIEFKLDDPQGLMQVLIDSKKAFVYRYSSDVDLPHYFPVLSPSGKSLTVQKTEPYPHHRSVWFADHVQLEGHRKVNFYAALYTRADSKQHESPFRDHIRHVEFLPGRTAGSDAEIGMKLRWEMDFDVPVLDELRQMRVVDLGKGEYFFDLVFTVTSS